jgi:hypothetical protein
MLSMPSSFSFCCTVRQKDSQLAPSGTGTATFLLRLHSHIRQWADASLKPLFAISRHQHTGVMRQLQSQAGIALCYLRGLASLTETNTSLDASCTTLDAGRLRYGVDVQRQPDRGHAYKLATRYTDGASAPCRLARCRSLTWLQRCRRVKCVPALKRDASATCSDKHPCTAHCNLSQYVRY